MEAPEKAILSSYILKYLNRDSSARVDRLLKDDYTESRRNPLMIDLMLRCQLMAFFSDSGCGKISADLYNYYKDQLLYSILMDAKNMLVVSSKENIVNSNVPLSPKFYAIAKMLIDKDKDKILKGHIKSVLASCILMGELGSKFEKFMQGQIEMSEADKPIIEFIVNTCRECQSEIKTKIDESLPLENR